MATSPLDPANIITRADRILGRVHGAAASPDAEVKEGADISPDHVEQIDLDDEDGATK